MFRENYAKHEWNNRFCSIIFWCGKWTLLPPESLKEKIICISLVTVVICIAITNVWMIIVHFQKMKMPCVWRWAPGEPEPLEKKPGAVAGAALTKNTGVEIGSPKNYAAPRKIIRGAGWGKKSETPNRSCLRKTPFYSHLYD